MPKNMLLRLDANKKLSLQEADILIKEIGTEQIRVF